MRLHRRSALTGRQVGVDLPLEQLQRGLGAPSDDGHGQGGVAVARVHDVRVGAEMQEQGQDLRLFVAAGHV